jgi:hypothetical protein
MDSVKKYPLIILLFLISLKSCVESEYKDYTRIIQNETDNQVRLQVGYVHEEGVFSVAFDSIVQPGDELFLNGLYDGYFSTTYDAGWHETQNLFGLVHFVEDSTFVPNGYASPGRPNKVTKSGFDLKPFIPYFILEPERSLSPYVTFEYLDDEVKSVSTITSDFQEVALPLDSLPEYEYIYDF